MVKEVATLQVRLDATVARFERQMKNASRTVDRQSGRMERRTAKLKSRMGGSFDKIAGRLAILAAAFLSLRAVDASLTRLSGIAKIADKVGLSTDALQELRSAAEQSGVATRTLDMAMQRFARRLAEARAGTGEAKKALAQLGIEFRDANGVVKSNEQVLNEVADAMSKLENGSDQLAIAFKLFDSEGAALVNTLRDGSAGLEKMRQAARDMGAVISGDSVRAAEVMRTNIDLLTSSLSALFDKMVGIINLSLVSAFNLDDGIGPAVSEANAKLAVALAERKALIDSGPGAAPGPLLKTLNQKIVDLKGELAILGAIKPTVTPPPPPPPGKGRKGKDTTGATMLASLDDRLRALDREDFLLRAVAGSSTKLAVRFEREDLTRALLVASQKEGSKITEEEIALAKARIALIEDQTLANFEYEQSIKDVGDAGRDAAEAQRQLARDLEDVADRLLGAIQNADSFKDALKRIGFELAEIALRGAFGQGPGGGVLNKLFGVGAGGLLGLAFGGGGGGGDKIKGFARGGVINGPATFPMPNGVGLMGEAGPEAIMPLTRRGGKLGVSGGGGVTIVQNNDFTGVDGVDRGLLQAALAQQKAEILRAVPGVASAGMTHRPSLRR